MPLVIYTYMYRSVDISVCIGFWGYGIRKNKEIFPFLFPQQKHTHSSSSNNLVLFGGGGGVFLQQAGV